MRGLRSMDLVQSESVERVGGRGRKRLVQDAVEDVLTGPDFVDDAADMDFVFHQTEILRRLQCHVAFPKLSSRDDVAARIDPQGHVGCVLGLDELAHAVVDQKRGTVGKLDLQEICHDRPPKWRRR